jgi:diguanylate cyclase (GGDEF)-like protein
MLWNKRKPSDPSRAVPTVPQQSGYRVAEPDRALTTIGALLGAYGRFAFDAAESATVMRDRCEKWAQHVMLGEQQRSATQEGEGPPQLGLRRDFRGVERFFEEVRKRESEFVLDNLSGLRRAVIALGRSLSGSMGEDRDADAQLEERMTALSRALDQGNVSGITRSAASLIEASRSFIRQRRERDVRHVQKLDKELRALRECMSREHGYSGNDELTGFAGRAQYEQQLDQLSAIGMLLAEPPWLVVLEVSAGKSPAANARRERAVPDASLLEVSHSVSRTFLRRQDFAARTGPNELALLLVDMSRDELVAALERLLTAVRNPGRDLPRAEHPWVSIGLVRLRLNEDAEHWRARANAALERTRQDGGDGYTVGTG